MLEEAFRNIEPRMEIKIRENWAIIPEFRAWLLTHPCAFKTAFPSRQVNNIYFDTLGMDSYFDHVSGFNTHNKLRFRWYGKSISNMTGNFEIKRKDNGFIKKILFPIGKEMDLKSETWAHILEELKSYSNDFFKLMQINLQPILMNHYQREYYVSGDNKFRVTIDYQMKAFDQRNYRKPNLSFQTPLINDAIIEIKCALENVNFVDTFLDDIPFRISKNSKYLSAIPLY